ncbi:uricase [Mycobacteroides abscessus subsp. massiliense]|nr:uricase [Mycobacteroides abscessus subsp. massiliense]
MRTAEVTVDGVGAQQQTWVIGGLKDLVVLKSTGSEFHDFLEDKYTILQPTTDRVMATSLVAKWRFVGTDIDDGGLPQTHQQAKQCLFVGQALIV